MTNWVRGDAWYPLAGNSFPYPLHPYFPTSLLLMSHPLKQRLGRLRRQVRLVVVVYGVSWVVGGVLAAVLGLGLADYVLRFQDRGIRVICSLAAGAVFGWTTYRYLYVPLGVRLRDVDLARRLERWRPELQDGLASAVEFLDQSEDDPTAGSVALRRAVIVKTTADVEEVDFERALERRPAQRAGLIALAIALVTMIVAAVDPASSRIAVARLINPFGNVSWPQRTHLVLRQPVERVARGQPFEIEVIDRFGARLPHDARILYQHKGSDGQTIEESEPMQVLAGALVARRENVSRPFSYRVVGGDDRQMPWLTVDVVEPPAVESLDVELTPPAYTGWPKEKTAGPIRALAGTRVHMTGKATKPLRAAAVALDDGREFPAQIGPDGRTFTTANRTATEMVLEKSGSYWFQLTDADGLTGSTDTHWEIRVVADHGPSVTLQQPTGTVFVTPNATVPLRILAKDDLALARVDLTFTRSDKPGDVVLPLYNGPQQVKPGSTGLAGEGESQRGERRVVDYQWQLASLDLVPGVQVTFQATATDYRPQTGKSEPARLSIITPEELAERIANRQALILAELGRVLEMQRQGRQQVAALETRAAEVGRLDRVDLDRLRGAELNQRQVQRTLAHRTEGVPVHILRLLAELANNRIDNPDIQRRMQGLLDEIERLGNASLPAAERQLTSTIKIAQNSLQDSPAEAANQPAAEPVQQDPAFAAALTAAAKHQDEIIASLERMLGQLSRWDNYRRFHREIGQLIRSQEELNRRTLELGQRTLAKELRDLIPQELADLKVASREQSELARQLDRLLQGMDETIVQLHSNDPLAAETIAEALERARQLAIAATMGSASDGVEQNRIGQAVGQQKQVVENLQEILDILANRRESELARLAKKLDEVQRELGQLADHQQSIARRMDQTSSHAQSQQQRELAALAAEQEALRDETQRIIQRLERLMAPEASDSLRQASDQMSQAAQAAQQSAGRRAADAAKLARKLLDEAVKQLAEKQRQNSAELASQQIAQLHEALRSIHDRQQKALEGTRELDRQRQASPGELNREQATVLYDLAKEQRSLQTETQRLADTLATAQGLQMVLGQTSSDMARAASLLDRSQTDAAVQEAEQNALARLAQLLDAPKSESPEGDKCDQQDGQCNKPPSKDSEQAKAGSKPGQVAPSPSTEPGAPASRIAEMTAVLKNVWGELPEHERQQMLELPVEEFLPKYQLQIESYYKRLSHEHGSANDAP